MGSKEVTKPWFLCQKSFERIFKELETIRVEVKKNFETKQNKFYDSLRKNLKKKLTIREIDKNLIQKMNFYELNKKSLWLTIILN